MIWDEIALEIAIIERLAHENVRQRIASQQLGEAWVGLEAPSDQSFTPDFSRA